MECFGIVVINMDNDIAIKIHKLSKVVKKKTLLKPLSCEITKGKILALCGGNGAGKSTLIRLMTGVINPTTGYVMIHGLTKKKQKKQYIKQFGYMPDDFTFPKDMTAKEIMTFYAKIKKVNSKSIKEVLDKVGLVDHMNMKVGQYSKGMNQRLLMAQMFLGDPSIYILDEPTNGLDPYWIKQFAQLMMEAKEDGKTIVFSTHDLHVAEQIADEVMFLSDGEVIARGPISQYEEFGLYHTFQNLYFNKVHPIKTIVATGQ